MTTDGGVPNNLLVNKVDKTSVETYYAETSVKAKETVFIWTIRNASKLYMPAGKHCTSPHFAVNFNGKYTRWTLHYFPGGYDEFTESFASLEICEHVYEEEDLELYAKISVIDASKMERMRYQNFISPNKLLKNVLTIPKFISKHNISDFTVNGNLKIICRLYSNTKLDCSSVTSNLCNSLENHENANELATAVLNNFEKLLEGSKFSDVTLKTSTREFPAHKAILCARSRVFAAMFEHDMKESATNVVSITDIDEEVIQVMLKFIYTGKVDNVETLADKLWIAADKYELNALKTMCENVLLKSLSDKTIVDILIFVDRYNTEKLRDSAIEFVTMHANELSLSDNFNATMKMLSPSLLALVIKALMSVA